MDDKVARGVRHGARPEHNKADMFFSEPAPVQCGCRRRARRSSLSGLFAGRRRSRATLGRTYDLGGARGRVDRVWTRLTSSLFFFFSEIVLIGNLTSTHKLN